MMALEPFPGFRPFPAHHCVTGSMRHVYDLHGVDVSEELLLGLGAGVGFPVLAPDGRAADAARKGQRRAPGRGRNGARRGPPHRCDGRCAHDLQCPHGGDGARGPARGRRAGDVEGGHGLPAVPRPAAGLPLRRPRGHGRRLRSGRPSGAGLRPGRRAPPGAASRRVTAGTTSTSATATGRRPPRCGRRSARPPPACCSRRSPTSACGASARRPGWCHAGPWAWTRPRCGARASTRSS